MSASHVYEAEIGRIDTNIVENGYFNVRGRPSQGARLVWIPKDNGDQEFFDTNSIIVNSNTGANINKFVPTADVIKANGGLTV